MTNLLLDIKHLGVHYNHHRHTVRAVHDVNLQIERGDIVALVGESGCGKSTLARALLQLLRPTEGEVWFAKQELTKLWQRRFGRWVWGEPLRLLRQHMQIVFQDPYASLNPRKTIWQILCEPLETFNLAQGAKLQQMVEELLHMVGLDPAYLHRYPHQFSGGQRQRIGIARALSVKPQLLVADEPISALDVSIQAQILNLLIAIQRDLQLTLLFISHDLSAVRYIAKRVVMMLSGQIVEVASVRDLFEQPAHPYTQLLLASILTPHSSYHARHIEVRATTNTEQPQHIANHPQACPFIGRCPKRSAICQRMPALKKLTTTQPTEHQVACHHASF